MTRSTRGSDSCRREQTGRRRRRWPSKEPNVRKQVQQATLCRQERACCQQDFAMAQSRARGEDERSIGKERRSFACAASKNALSELNLARAVLAPEVQVSKEGCVLHSTNSSAPNLQGLSKERAVISSSGVSGIDQTSLACCVSRYSLTDEICPFLKVSNTWYCCR